MTAVLLRLQAFDENAAVLAIVAGAAEQRDALEQRVGSRRILLRHDAAADGDGALRDVEAADLSRRGRRRLDVGFRLRRDDADLAALGERKIGRDGKRADDVAGRCSSKILATPERRSLSRPLISLRMRGMSFTAPRSGRSAR